MKRRLFLLFVLFVATAALAADKLPKKVEKARVAVAKVLTYTGGQLKGNGTAVFIGSAGDILVPHTLMCGTDSAVVIDAKGKAYPVSGIVGLNSLYDCVRMRVQAGKKQTHLLLSVAGASAGDELYMLAYGNKGEGEVTGVKVSAVDSLYSNAYFTLDVKSDVAYEGLPLVNAAGELVAIMQPMTTGDTCSYAIAATIADELVTTSVTYGRGYHSGMGIRTLLPEETEVALSCMYMQGVIGDSASYGKVVEEFIKAYPKNYEGYLSKAEFEAVYCRDIDAADAAWERSLSLADRPAEVYFSKAKTISSIMHGGDFAPHSALTEENILSLLDKAIAADSLPVYVYYKADRLYSAGRYDEAYGCYMSLAGRNGIEQDAVFLNASQCQRVMKNYDVAIELMDSAVNHALVKGTGDALPLVFSRALMKDSVGRYREAVMDYNFYESNAAYGLGANFYYIRSQAETKCKMYQQALNDLETAISMVSDYALYHFEKGLLCYRLNMLDDAVAALETAKGLAGEASDIYYLLGCAYSRIGNDGLAEDNLKKAVALGHPDAENRLKELKK